MSLEVRLVVGLALAAAAVYALTPMAIRVAGHLNFYDKPAGYKGHSRPTPYLGGLAVCAGFITVMLIAATNVPSKTVPLLTGMAILWVVGTVDDKVNISPWIRVAIEMALAAGLWSLGLGWDVGLGDPVDLLLTMFWIVAVINAFNLFDNMDGAASTMTLAVALCLTVLGLLDHNNWLAISAAVLSGACLGFLPFNLRSPARIFLGDGGSMPLGFAAATLVMIGAQNAAPAGQSLLLGLLLVGVPAADTALVIFSRRRRGVGVLTGGRDHLTHRTRQWMQTAFGVAIALGGIQALVSSMALFAIRGGAVAIVTIGVLYFVAGATAIAFLESRYESELEVMPTNGAAAVRRPFVLPGGSTRIVALGIVTAFGATAALSTFSSGFYSRSQWVPIGIGIITLATASAIAAPPRVSRSQLFLFGGLVGIAVWALISALWAPSIEQATTEGNRWFVLAGIFATAVILARSASAVRFLVLGLAGGIAFVAAWVLIKMLGADAYTLFLSGRLNEPLGYVNAEGTLFLMGFWLWFAAFERFRGWRGAAALGVATTLASMVLLSQSRGAALATIGSIAIVVACVPGAKLRRVYALLASAVGVMAASGPLLGVYRSAGGASLIQAAHSAAVAALLAGTGVALVWGLAALAVERFAADRPAHLQTVRRVGVGVLVVGAIAIAGAALASTGRISDYVDRQWTAFKLQENPAGRQETTAHLLSGGGTRYDYWRIAWHAFEDNPLKGVGAGNYDRPYFKARTTTEDVKQPHSLELQTLSELGLVGGLLLILVVGAVVVGGARRVRALSRSPRGAALAVAGVGVVSAWLIHTSVDWIHLFPGLTAVALTMAAILLRNPNAKRVTRGQQVATEGRRRITRGWVAAGVASLVVVAAAASLSREGLADLFLRRAKDALAANPAKALEEANRSLRLDGENPESYYVKAAALSRFNRGTDARSALVVALHKEPDNFVTWTLLGDLAVRRHDFREAKESYGQAHRLNPIDPAIAKLAEDPRNALK